MNRLSRLVTTTACVVLLALPLAAADPLLPPGLVPGTLGPKTDSQGGVWMIQPSGQTNVQNSLVNDIFTLATTANGGEEFAPTGPVLASKDGSLNVLQGTLGQLQVTRLVRLDQRLGVVRWVEVLRNPGTTAISGSVGYNLRLQTQAGQVVSESGAAVGATLGPKEGALLLCKPQNYRNQWGDVILLLSDPAVKDKPVISNQNNYMFGFTWNLVIPPGKTVALMHAAALRPTNGVPDTKEAQRLLVAASSRAFLADLPAALRKVIVNWRAAGLVDDALPAADIPDELLAARGDGDLLALGVSTRLRGTAALAAPATAAAVPAGAAAPAPAVPHLVLTVDGRAIDLAWERILALAGGRVTRVFLQDGQSLAGTLAPAQVVFTLASGQAVAVSTERIGWLLRAPRNATASGDAPVLISTRDGVRLRARAAADVRLRAGTPWGVVDLRLADIAALTPAEGGGCNVRLTDGSRFHAHVAGEDLLLDTALLGPRRIRLDQLAGIASLDAPRAPASAPAPAPAPGPTAPAANASPFGQPAFGQPPAAAPAPLAPPADDEPRTPYALLAGSQLLMSAVELPELHVRLAGNRLAVPPSQVRLLVNREAAEGGGKLSDEPPVRLELWGGDVVEGVLDEPLLPLRVGGTLLQVPVSDVVEIHVPTPVIAAATRTRIADLVGRLGDTDWARREAASKALSELGGVARQPLEEALAAASDPEVKMRLEKLIAELP